MKLCRGERFARIAAAWRAILELQATDPDGVDDGPRSRRGGRPARRRLARRRWSSRRSRGARRIADLGSGAGWPGLALAAALPARTVALVESAIRRCRYLERAVEAAGWRTSTVVHARAEEWADGLGAYDLVTARALAALPVVVEYAAPLLAEGGVLVAWKGAASAEEAQAGARAAAELGLEAGRGAARVAVSRAPSGARCTCSARSRPRRSGSRAGRGWLKRPLRPLTSRLARERG